MEEKEKKKKNTTTTKGEASPRASPRGVPGPGLFHTKRAGAKGRAAEGRVPLPHSSFFKTLNFFYLFIFLFFFSFFFFLFFTKYHFSSHFFPYSTGVAHPQAGQGQGRVGDWSEKVQDAGEGSGSEHHENPAGPGRGTRWGAGRSLEGRAGWLGDAGSRVFPKNE